MKKKKVMQKVKKIQQILLNQNQDQEDPKQVVDMIVKQQEKL